VPSLKDALQHAEAEGSGRDPDIVALEALTQALHKKGIDVVVDRGKVLPARPERDREATFDLGQDHLRLGLVSDTHSGSRFEQLTALRQFYAYADERKVDAFLHAGDVTQGSDKMHRGMELEVHAHGADAQGAYVVDVYPRSRRKGVKTYVIGGNHDDSFLNDGGMNVVRRICQSRPDMVYIGQDAAYLTLGRLRTYLIHPDGGGSYAKSYKGQKISEAIPPEKDVVLLLIGHFHTEATFRWRGTRVVQLPCFQSQYAWLARKALYPDLGGIIVDVWLDERGGLRRFAYEYVDFPVLDEDWDHEASDRAGRGWAVGDVIR
jgi:predicted phosphodiesterase